MKAMYKKLTKPFDEMVKGTEVEVFGCSAHFTKIKYRNNVALVTEELLDLTKSEKIAIELKRLFAVCGYDVDFTELLEVAKVQLEEDPLFVSSYFVKETILRNPDTILEYRNKDINVEFLRF